MTMLNTTDMPAARRYKIAREALGLKQEELAELMGVARSTIGEWERGATEPSASKLVKLAQVTNQSLDWFAEGLALDLVRPKRLELPTFWMGGTLELEHELLLIAEAVST